jgi:hypothetical protein
MKGQKALFSKASDEWETPQWLFDSLYEEFHFHLDAWFYSPRIENFNDGEK